MNFYIKNQTEETVSVLSTDEVGAQTAVLSAIVDEKLSSYDELKLTIPADSQDMEYLKEDNTIVFEDQKGWREYLINYVEDVDSTDFEREITADLSSIELADEIIKTELSKVSKDPTNFLNAVLAGTRWTVGSVDSAIYSSTFSEETQFKSVLEVLDLMSSEFNCEVQFSYVVDRGLVVKRQVNLYKQFGSDNGKRFEIDKDVSSIKRTIDTETLKTAIIPYGKEPEEGEARLSIKDIEWKTSNGDPADKPKGQDWLGSPIALANWGRVDTSGKKRHRFISMEIDVETDSALTSMAWIQLARYTNPKITYESDVIDLYALTEDKEYEHEKVNLGDTVIVIDNYFAVPIQVITRITEMTRNLIEPDKNKIVFGDSKQLFSVSAVENRVDELNNKLNEVERNTNAVAESANGKNTNNYGSDEPTKNVTGDTWYRPHPTKPNETQMLIWDGLEWVLKLDTSKVSIVSEELEQVKTDTAESIKSANSAVEKADQAIKDAGFAKVEAGKAQEDATKAISDANKAATEAGTALSTANTAKTNAGTALTIAQTSLTNSGTALTNAEKALKAYDDLDISTQNLVLNSGEPKSSSIYLVAEYKMSEEWVVGQEYTVTIRGQVNEGNFFRVWYDDGYSSFSQSVYDEKRDLWVMTGAVTRLARPTKDTLRIYNVQSATAASAEVEWIQVVKGNKVLNGWTPNPEDVQVQLTDINGELSRKVAQTTFDTLNGTVQSQSTKITQNQTAIGLKADKTVTDIINQTVAKHTLDIKATADGLAMKAEKALVDSLNGTVATHTSQIKATADGLGLKADKSLVDTVKGTVDTHTAQIKATSDGLGLKADKTLVDTVKGTVDKHTTDIKANADGLKLKAEASAVNTLTGTVNTHTNQISANATAISARLTSAQVDSLVAGKNYVNQTTLNATANGLSSSITQVENTVKTKSDKVDAMSGGGKVFKNPLNDSKSQATITGALVIKTPITNNYMTKISISGYNWKGATSNVDLDVSFYAYQNNTFLEHSYVNKGNYPVGQVRLARDSAGRTVIIIGTGNSVWNYPKIQVTEAIIGYTTPPDSYQDGWGLEYVTSLSAYTAVIDVVNGTDYKAEIDTNVTKISTVEQTVNGIQTTVASKADKSQITQLSSQISSKVESATYNSKMTQLDSAINLRVQKGDVIGQINVEAGKTLIQNKSLYLDAATVTFSGKAFIPSAAITALAADKITAGTINAANVKLINLDASQIVTGTMTGITINSPFNYSYDGAIMNQGMTTMANGEISMGGKFTHAFGGTFMKINPDTIYAENLQSNGNVRSMFKLSGVGLELNVSGKTAKYTQDGIYFESGGNASVKYNTGDARIEISSYNGVSLGVNSSGTFYYRISTGGGQDGLAPFVDIWTDLNLRSTLNVMGNTVKNAAHITGVKDILFANTSNRIVQGNDNILNIMSPAQINMGYTDGTITSNSMIISNWGTQFTKQVHFNGNQINGASNIRGVKTMLFDGSSNRIVQGSDGFFNILAPIQLNLGWTDGTNSFNTMVITRNQAVIRRTLNMDGNSISNQSDRRLKKDIVNSERIVLDSIKKWNFVEYYWKGNDKPSGNQFGLIAQDTPELMIFEEEDDYYGINISRQIMLNSKGVQELAFKNDEQDSRVDDLEEKIKELETIIREMGK